MNNELHKTWKEVVVTWSRCNTGIFLEEMTESGWHLSQDRRSVALGGLVVIVLAIGLKIRCSNPVKDDDDVYRNFLGRGSEVVGPMS
jgi:hypothetical protein